MKKQIYTLIAAALILGVSGFKQSAYAQNEMDSQAKLKDEIYIIYNKMRLENNRNPVEASPALMKAAKAHADDMFSKKYFAHNSLNGENHAQRIRKSGFKACYTSENIAKGQRNAQTVMGAWMGSDGHRKNLLNAKAENFGVARTGNIWVMVFARGC